MDPIYVVLLVGAALVAVVLLIAYMCFRMAFLVPKRLPRPEYDIPKGKEYEPYREIMVNWMKEVRAMPHEDLQITSFDGLTLRGKYYEYAPDAPIELMFHGYRGNADRDLCGGVQRCFALGHSALIVDQRACGDSEGKVITFGVNESRDCMSWLELMHRRFGPDARIILTGISMGAATVCMAAGRKLPDNVVGVLADCGYDSAENIIKKVIRDMKLPPVLAYPFVKLGAHLFGGFDLEEMPPADALKRCEKPIIFFHGEADGFVPCEMSRINCDVCPAPKRLVTVKDAEHGLSYIVDPEGYLQAMREFFGPELSN
jgi:pimeloyl-ACP methyl ester carboxylesterase